MGYPRRLLVNPEAPGWYHCISRCVRRAFLCGDQYEHRRQWISDAIALLASVFAVEISHATVMSNHLHLELFVDPLLPRKWSAAEVVDRWARLYPKALEKVRQGASSPQEADRREALHRQRLSRDRHWLKKWRQHLGDLGWFHKLLKEPIARRANKEDDVTGHFWEGRFKSIALLCDAATLACGVYIDLNPARAQMAATLIESSHTSIQGRIEMAELESRLGEAAQAQPLKSTPIPLKPIPEMFPQLTTAQYVALVSRAGGVPVRTETAKERFDAVLTSMGIDPPKWEQAMRTTCRWFGTAVGRAGDLVKEAARRGVRRVVNPFGVFTDQP